MKTLKSILISPNRMLSNEEMNNLKGGNAQANCTCIWTSPEDPEFFFEQSVTVTGGDCVAGASALSGYYAGLFEVICY
jgi:natural product precursor